MSLIHCGMIGAVIEHIINEGFLASNELQQAVTVDPYTLLGFVAT